MYKINVPLVQKHLYFIGIWDLVFCVRRMVVSTDRFSISCKLREPPFLGFCRNLVTWGFLGSYLQGAQRKILQLQYCKCKIFLCTPCRCKIFPLQIWKLSDFENIWCVIGLKCADCKYQVSSKSDHFSALFWLWNAHQRSC